MWDYGIGAANIAIGVFLHALLAGKINRSEEGREYWSNWTAEHPTFSKYAPAFLVAFGALRIVLALRG